MTTYPKIITTLAPGYPKRTLVTEGSFPKRELVTSGVFPKVRIVEEEGYPKVLLPTLLDQSTAILNGLEPYHYFDFTQDRALFAGVDVGGVTASPGWAFTRATTANYHNSDGTLTSFGSGVPRLGSRGLMLEGARTNLFLNSDAGATQNVTVTAAAHTLSFYGTGTITLSGASTAGPLVGTGASNRVSLTFTPSAGTLTCTVSGTCTNVQLELGTGASSYISTAGASVTRNADLPVITLTDPAYPLAMWVEFELFADVGLNQVMLTVDNNSGLGTERTSLRVSAADFSSATMVSGGVQVADVNAGTAVATSVVYKLAGRFALNDVQSALDSVLGTVDTSAALPVGTPVTLRFSGRADGSQLMFGFLRRAAIFTSALTDSQLQAITNRT